jgi:malonate-semialdehyde dehydrogenase (acetylating)/methylmalonate-semialdehyde dehydrogenase
MSLKLQTKLPAQPVIGQNLIGGEWVKGEAGSIEVISPYNGKKIGEVSVPSKSQIETALAKAAEAQRAWGRTPIKERSNVLFNFRNILLRDLEEISHLKASECGKTFVEARAGLMKGVEVLEYALSIQNLDLGGKAEVSRLVHCEYKR